MRGTKLLITLAISAILFSGCGLKQGTIIKINNKSITQSQFDKAFDEQVKNSIFGKMGLDIKSEPNSTPYLMMKANVVNGLIIKTLLDNEMDKRNIKATKEDLDKAIKEVIDNVGSKEQLDTMLKQNGVSTAQFKKELTEQIKMQKLAQQLGTNNVSDIEALKFYKENPDKFRYPERVRASHILISTDPIQLQTAIKLKNKNITNEELQAAMKQELAERKAKADRLCQQAKADINSFAKLAKENSDDTATAEKGGDLGFFTAKSGMAKEFTDAAFSQRPNRIYSVVKTQFGYHIILVTDRMAAGQVPYEKAKTDIKNYLQNQKQLKSLEDLVESLKKNSKIEFVAEDYNPQLIQDKLKKVLEEEQKNNKKK